LVPVGELEYWFPVLMADGASKNKKAEWANQAAMKLREKPESATDLLKFMQEIAAYQTAEALRMG